MTEFRAAQESEGPFVPSRDRSGDTPRSPKPRGRTTCRRCGADITHLRDRRDRQWCSKQCLIYFSREEKRRIAIKRRPRCMICDAPIRYGHSGVNLKARTCGRPDCVVKLYNWFTRYERKSA
jgi:hypothetical protein